MPGIPLVVESRDIAVARLNRPAAVQEDPLVFWNPEIYDLLQAQGARYRSTPIYVESGSELSHHWDQPIVADRTLCAVPSVDGGYVVPSPNCLVGDRWHNLRITATQTKSFAGGSPSGTLSIEALSQSLEAGFVIGFEDGYLLVTATATVGATSLALQRITGNVTVTSGDVAVANNGYFYQRGIGCPLIGPMNLAADPLPLMDDPRNNEATRKYACDGVAVSAMGAVFDKLLIRGFPGHGLWVSNPTALPTLTQRESPWDMWETHVGYANARDCLAGITLNSTDGTFDTLIGGGCRDYGVRLTGGNIQGGKIHGWGCGLGLWLSLGGHIDHAEGENCNYGANIFTPSSIGVIKVWDNRYRGLLMDVYETTIGAIDATHARSETSADPYATGYAFVLSGWNDRVNCQSVLVKASNGANGWVFGSTNNHTNIRNDLKGSVYSSDSSGTYGLRIKQSMSANGLKFDLNGFANCLYFDDGVVLTSNTFDFYGVTGNTIRWADGTTGTFGTPNIPAGVSAANDIEFHVY